MNKAAFYTHIRESLFAGKLSQSQVDGMNALLSVWEARYGDEINEAMLAYVLATVFHETARTMQPITEIGQKEYFTRYDNRKDLGNGPTDGYRYRGRGYVQLTGRANYANAGTHLEIPLEEKPDLALEPDYAAEILFAGMSEGWFTGKKLSDYFHDDIEDPVGARRIVNGQDRASKIAGYSMEFEIALAKARLDNGVEFSADGKPMSRSTTNIAAGIGGITGLLGTIAGHLTAARSAVETFLENTSLPAWVPVAVVATVGFGAFLWILRERYRKSYYEGV